MSASAKAEKEARARFRALMDKDVQHLRLGGRRDGTSVRLIGMASDLHGPNGVCTCCHGRAA